MKLSVLIPAYNEEGSIAQTINELYGVLCRNNVEHEILVVNDNSKDSTLDVLHSLQNHVTTLVVFTNSGPNGFGYNVRYGLERFAGDCVAIMMADASDSPEDLILFYNKLLEGYDCVFGNRFIKGGKTIDYPWHKLILNRIFNNVVRLVFRLNYNDVTNAFKLYRRETIEGLRPFLSPHFNLTLELPLKAIVRGYSFAVIPNSWTNRKHGVSKLKIREMGSRYFFILLYCFIEKMLVAKDYKKK